MTVLVSRGSPGLLQLSAQADLLPHVSGPARRQHQEPGHGEGEHDDDDGELWRVNQPAEYCLSIVAKTAEWLSGRPRSGIHEKEQISKLYQQFSALKVYIHNHFISWVNDALILIWIKMLLTIFLARWPAPWCSRASTVPGAAWSLCCTRRRSSTRRLASSGPTPAPAPEPAASGRAPSSRSVVCVLNNYMIPDTVEAEEKDTTPSKAGQRCMFLACTLTGLSQDLDFVRLIKTTFLIGTLFAGDGAPHAGPQVNNHITRRGHRLSRHRHKFTR